MKFETTAVIKEIGAIESVGANGFQKRNLILSEQSGEYENLVCVEFSGDKLERPDSHQVGQMVKVSGFINCREWEGRYFTSLRGSFIQNAGEQQQAPQAGFGTQQQAQQQMPVQQVPQQQVYQQPVQNVAPQNVQQPATPVFSNPQPASMAPPQQPNLGQAPNGENIPF